jgi:hypothetical protein
LHLISPRLAHDIILDLFLGPVFGQNPESSNYRTPNNGLDAAPEITQDKTATIE